MKIAFFVSKFPNLSETFILNQITGLIDRGHEIDIYTDKPADTKKYHPDIYKYNLLERTFYIGRPDNYLWRLIKLFQLPLVNFIRNPSIFFRALNLTKYGTEARSLKLLYASAYFLKWQFKYDIIHAHFGPNGQRVIYLRDIGVIKGKIITTFHGYDISMYLKLMGDKFYQPLFASGDAFSPISEQMKRRLIELNCNEKKIIVHRVGIDCSKFSFTTRQVGKNGKIKLITIARLVEKKGVEYGIRSVANLIKSGMNVEYNIVGDGHLNKKLQKLIHELNVTDKVKLLGWKHQQEVIQLINTSHILLAPSVTDENGDQEGIPTVIMEAMATGLPVISTYHSGIPELVQNGISGFLVPERDVDTLTEKLRYLIEHSELWDEMGKAGRKFVESHHNIHILNDKLVEIYQNMIQLNKEITVPLKDTSIVCN